MAAYILALLFALLVASTAAMPLDVDDTDEGRANRIDGDDNVIDLSGLDGSLFGVPDNTTGELLEKYNPEEMKVNPEEMGSYLEGDMLIPKIDGRNGMASKSLRWAGGVLPFEIRGSFNAHEMDLIERGIKEYHAKTCIKFVPRTNQRDYISITNGRNGCWSSVGKIGGKQDVNLQTPGCMSKVGTFLHEVMHALGFLHEQNRHERDSYVTINWSNIQSGVSTNFDKASSSTTTAFGVPYDYGSVMHYSAYAFSVNGRPTIQPKSSQSLSMMGQRDGFSSKDLMKINQMYQCKTTQTGKPISLSSQPSSSSSTGGKPQKPVAAKPSSGNTGVHPIVNLLGNLIGAFTQGEEEGAAAQPKTQ